MKDRAKAFIIRMMILLALLLYGNFRTYKESCKDKRARKTPKDEFVIFKNTQEPIIDEETWNMVQELRKTVDNSKTMESRNTVPAS